MTNWDNVFVQDSFKYILKANEMNQLKENEDIQHH